MQFMSLLSTQISVIQTMTSCQFTSMNRKMVIIMFPCAVVLENLDHLGCSRASGYPRSAGGRPQQEGIVHHQA